MNWSVYNNLTPATCSHAINLDELDFPHMDLPGLGERFTEEEVWGVIRSLPPDKAPCPNRFTTRFLQHT
jgi:hypothetical protein